MYDLVIIGCGLSGMVVARKIAESGKKVLMIDKRDTIGGNMYDYYDDNGILVQNTDPIVFLQMMKKYVHILRNSVKQKSIMCTVRR